MELPQELSHDECYRLLCGGSIGRVALCTPEGPRIIPVTYAVLDQSVVFRTSPYGLLGTQAWNADLAFETDELDYGTKSGWSVVAVGHGAMLDDAMASARGASPAPIPWAGGHRLLHIQLTWRELTGRRVGPAQPERG